MEMETTPSTTEPTVVLDEGSYDSGRNKRKIEECSPVIGEWVYRINNKEPCNHAPATVVTATLAWKDGHNLLL